MGRDIEFLNQEERLRIDPASVEACIHALDAYPEYRIPAGSIEVLCVDLPNCRQLHETFFGDPDPTDVMTFPGDPEDDHAGDIAICPAVAFSASGESGLDFNTELTLYLIHACLHLAGLEDHDEVARQKMRAGESKLMHHLESKQALLSCQWLP